MTRQVGKYGCRPTPHGQKWALQFGDYIDATALPPIPSGSFGHMNLIPEWGVLMNTTLGCCVVSGAEHETMLWTAESGNMAVFNDGVTVRNYQLLGNYEPGNPYSDQGCDMLTAAQLRVTQGIVDANGNTHKLGAVLELQPGNLEQLWYACWLFDGVGCGITVPREWEMLFESHAPWDANSYNPNDIMGGHYVPLMAREDGDIDLVTWGAPQLMTPDGYQAAAHTVLCYATEEKLRNGKDLEGLSWSDIRADMAKVAAL